MYEVELKVRAAHESVREKLSALDARSQGTVRQEDTYYDAPHRAFEETDEALRLRRETGDREMTQLTYKGPLVESASKTREERETAIENAEEMDGILDALGFSSAVEVEKNRERFECGDYIVSLDSIEELGEFVEVEQEAEGEDIERVRDGARDLLRDLGCDPTEQIQTSYLELLVENGSNSHDNSR